MLQSTPLGDDSHWYVSIVVDSIVICNKPSSHTIISCSGWVSIEIGALIVIDAAVRLIPGVLGNSDSLIDETFERNLLEYPQYTKPKKWENKDVPDVLLSGDHAKIKGWRLEQSKDITRRRRPDLWEKYKKDKWKI